MIGALVAYHEFGVAILSALAAGGGVAIYKARAEVDHTTVDAAGLAVESLRVALEQARLEFQTAKLLWETERASLESQVATLTRRIDQLNTKELKLRRRIEELERGETTAH